MPSRIQQNRKRRWSGTRPGTDRVGPVGDDLGRMNNAILPFLKQILYRRCFVGGQNVNIGIFHWIILNSAVYLSYREVAGILLVYEINIIVIINIDVKSSTFPCVKAAGPWGSSLKKEAQSLLVQLLFVLSGSFFSFKMDTKDTSVSRVWHNL